MRSGHRPGRAFFGSVKSGRAAALFAFALAGCGDGSRTAVIGLALPQWGGEIVEVAHAELADRQEQGDMSISLVADLSVTAAPINVDIALAERLVEIEGLVAVVGHGGSRESLAAAAVYNAEGIVQVVPTGTSRRLANAGPWTVALPPNDSAEGAFMARFAVDRLGARTAVVFFVNDDYGVGLRDGFAAALVERGGRVLEAVPVDERADHATLLDGALLGTFPDVIVSAARGRATAGIARRLQERGVALPVVAGDGAAQPRQLAAESGAGAGLLYVVNFWLPEVAGPEAADFLERWAAHSARSPESSEAMVWDAVMLLATAVREMGREPARVRDYLRSLGDSRPPYRGVTGPISFHAASPARLVMARLAGDRFVPVTP